MSMYIERTEVSTDQSPLILWQNRLKTGTISVSSEATGGEGENAIDDNTYDFWTPTALPATWAMTFPISRSMDYAAIAAHNLGSTGNTVAVEYHNGTGWVELASVTPTDDSVIIIAFNGEFSTQYRFYISGGTVPSIGVLYLGDEIRFDSGILPAYTPLYMAEEVELLKSQSLNGQFITNRVNRRGAKSSFSLNILERSFVESTAFQDFRDHYNDGEPFFFASNPSELTNDVSYCWRQQGGEINPTFQENGIFYKVNLSLEAYIGD